MVDTARNAKALGTVGTSAKALSGDGSRGGKNHQKKITIHPFPEQPPKLTSALRYMLRRYADDLLPFAERTGNKTAARMIDACEYLVRGGDDA